MRCDVIYPVSVEYAMTKTPSGICPGCEKVVRVKRVKNQSGIYQDEFYPHNK